MSQVDWYVEGPSFGSCNCCYGCPCQFEDLPTHGHCRGFEVLRVDKGHFGEVPLDGVQAALAYAWPGPVFKGHGEMQVIIDERANAQQREALAKDGKQSVPEPGFVARRPPPGELQPSIVLGQTFLGIPAAAPREVTGVQG